jgi:uncharacterized protein with PQ loop repeat
MICLGMIIKPLTPKKVLLFIAGAMWCCVGIMLMGKAIQWLSNYNGNPWICGSIGAVAGLVVHHLGFLKIVDKNLGRIALLPAKPCVFSFISWKSYGIIIIMVFVGMLLRHSLLPKHYLSVVYLSIGEALFLSSLRYFKNLLTSKRCNK